jgi:lysophospholipase L1-like esterase
MPPARAGRPAVAAASILAAIVAVLGLLAAAPPARAAAAVRYVALGDSYASGVGAGYMMSSSGACDRSTKAFSRLWDLAHRPASYRSAACTGATTGTVITRQLAALSASTTLVSIIVGGNDAGFVATIEACVVHPGGCAAAVRSAEAKIRTELPGRLASVLRDIRGAAPNARVVVLGYPDLYDPSVVCLGPSRVDRTDLNQAAAQLDAAIRAAAGRAGDTYADPRPDFAGHTICDPSPWLHAVSIFYISQSFHPTAAGQADGYLRAFSQALAG